MTRAWREDGAESMGQRIARAPLWPLAWLWRGASALHRRLYEWGVLRRSRLRCGVVSVGALQAGGSGKTPVAIAVANALRSRAPQDGKGRRVVLASRGYGRRRSRRQAVLCVSNGKEIVADTAEAGDEALLLATQAPGVQVYVARDRARVGDAIAEVAQREGGAADSSAFSLVLDDGFQHHRLARDVDLVVIDAAAGLGRACLPRGTRREGLAALDRASALVILDPPLAPSDREGLERRLPSLPRFYARRRFRDPRSLARARPAGFFASRAGAGKCPVPTLQELAGREVGVFSGIGRPASLRESVEAFGATVVAERIFGDHHRFRADDFGGDWLAAAPCWLTTAKDAQKLRASWMRGVPVYVLDMVVELSQPEALAHWVEERLEHRR